MKKFDYMKHLREKQKMKMRKKADTQTSVKYPKEDFVDYRKYCQQLEDQIIELKNEIKSLKETKGKLKGLDFNYTVGYYGTAGSR